MKLTAFKRKLLRKRWLSLPIIIPAIIVIGGGGAWAALQLGGSNPEANSSSAINLQKGLVAWWKLNGNTKDSTPYANDGTANGASPTNGREGQTNGAYNFNGSSNYISTPLTPTYSQLTVSVWFMANSLSGDNPRLVADGHTDSDNKGFQLMFNNGGATGFFDVGNGSTHGGSTWSQQLVTGKWYHYVGVYDGSHIYAYINGVQVASAAYAGGAVASDSVGASIGYNAQYGLDYFNGSIADVRIYDRGLSQAEVTALYQSYNASVQLDAGSVGLLDRWQFHGNYLDSAPVGNTLTTANASFANDQNGRANSALGSNGTSTYVYGRIGDGTYFGGNNPLTAMAWVYVSSTSSGPIFGVTDNPPGGSWNMPFLSLSGTTIYGWIYNNSQISATVSANAWHHVALTYNPSGSPSTILYIDGKQAGTAIGSYSSSGASDYFTTYIGGAKPSGVSSYLNAPITDVRAYDQVLSPSAIASIASSYNSQLELGGSGASGSVSLGKGLVAYWPMNGNAKDATPYADDCTSSGAGLANDRMGRADSAYAFNGSNNTLTCGATGLTNIDSPKSFSAWFNYSGSGIYDILTTNGGSSGNQLRINGNNLEVSEWGGSILITSSTNVSQNTWHLATFTYDGTTDDLYLDGTLIATNTNTPQSGAATAVYIGSYGTGEYFNGSIDDVRIYGRALNTAEVQALYHNYD